MQRFLAIAPILGVALVASLGCDARASGAVVREPASSAAAFDDSVGVNVHFSYADGPYANLEAVARLIRDLGVHHLRDGLTARRTDLCHVDRRLAGQGVRFTYITQPDSTHDTLLRWSECVGPAIEAFEGLNEYDIVHPAADTDWVTTLRSSQAALYRSVRTDAKLEQLSVIGPSLTSVGAARALGDISTSSDEGNIHDYFAGHEPETNGWGADGYGSIAFDLATASLNSAAQPVVATETGYGSGVSDRCVDEAAQAVYLPRLYLAQAAAGIRRTFEYELVDEGAPPFSSYGLVRRDLSPKPAYRALKSLLRELRGESALGASPGVPLALVGAPVGTHRALFARSATSYVLAVWSDAPVWDPRAQRPLAAVSSRLTLTSGVPLRSVRIVALNGEGNLVPGPRAPSTSTVSLNVGPRVTFVEFRTANAS